MISDWIRVRITAAAGSTFLDRMIRLVESAERHKMPNQIALKDPLVGLTIIFVFATAHHPKLRGIRRRPRSGHHPGGVVRHPHSDHNRRVAFGDRYCRAWTGWCVSTFWRCPGRAVEAAGDVDTLLLDKTGTITLGNRQATEFKPMARRD